MSFGRFVQIARIAAAALALACSRPGPECVDRVPNFAPTALNLTADATGLFVSGTSLVSYCGSDPGARIVIFKIDLSSWAVCRAGATLPPDAQPASPLPAPADCKCTFAYSVQSAGGTYHLYISKTPDQRRNELAVYDVSAPTATRVADESFFDARVVACP